MGNNSSQPSRPFTKALFYTNTESLQANLRIANPKAVVQPRMELGARVWLMLDINTMTTAEMIRVLDENRPYEIYMWNDDITAENLRIVKNVVLPARHVHPNVYAISYLYLPEDAAL